MNRNGQSMHSALQRKHLMDAPSKQGQGGAVLVVGLIILVVLTLLSVQGMRSNLAQERMGSNMRERNVAFQAAEAALRFGEREGAFDATGADLVDPFGWTPDANGLPTEGTPIPNFSGGQAWSDPRYNVGPPQYVRIGLTLPPEYRLIYPISSFGAGSQQGSVVVLHSWFEPMN